MMSSLESLWSLNPDACDNRLCGQIQGFQSTTTNLAIRAPLTRLVLVGGIRLILSFLSFTCITLCSFRIIIIPNFGNIGKTKATEIGRQLLLIYILYTCPYISKSCKQHSSEFHQQHKSSIHFQVLNGWFVRDRSSRNSQVAAGLVDGQCWTGLREPSFQSSLPRRILSTTSCQDLPNDDLRRWTKSQWFWTQKL